MSFSHRLPEIVASIAAIRQCLHAWTNDSNYQLVFVDGLRHLSPVKLIHDALAKCPNEIPAPGTAQLSFVKEDAFKERLRLDIGNIHHAISSGDWKAATVLGGSVIEALLLYALEQSNPTGITTAIETLVSKNAILRPDTNLEKWDLYCFKEVAAEAGLIKKDTASLTDLTRQYRNLIHPGRAQRLQMKCDRATAYAAVAALDRVVSDLTAKFTY